MLPLLAEGGIDFQLIQTILQGGVPTILLIACGALAYMVRNLLTQNNSLEREYRDKVEQLLTKQLEGQKDLTSALAQNTAALAEVRGSLKSFESLIKGHPS